MPHVTFTTDHPRLQEKLLAAVRQLSGNIGRVSRYNRPLLFEGGDYLGGWLECAPHEGLVYAPFNPAVALDNHRVFFHLQRPDGCFPACIRRDSISYAQIQMVVPIARTALALGLLLQNESFLREAYDTCTRWDRWLQQHRNTRGTGLCEAFCEWDSGHDNSPRWHGLPKACFHDDSARCDPNFPVLPYLAPDLSATVYGGRLALAKMAQILGKTAEANQWQELAETIRQAIMKYCFHEDDLCFYDRDARDNPVRIRGDVLFRVMQEHVPDQKLADAIFEKHILNPASFWTAFPLPSVAVDDPTYENNSDYNAWAGPSQALTALRTPLWFEYYNRYPELAHLMRQWTKAILAADRFGQQINPLTGQMGYPESYSPAALALIDFTTRLHGVHEDINELAWNAGLPEGANAFSHSLQTAAGILQWRQTTACASAAIGEKEIFRVTGSGRIVTDKSGQIRRLIGTHPTPQTLSLTVDGKTTQHILHPNETKSLLS